MADKRQLTLDPLDGFDREAGAWLSAWQKKRWARGEIKGNNRRNGRLPTPDLLLTANLRQK